MHETEDYCLLYYTAKIGETEMNKVEMEMIIMLCDYALNRKQKV